jgi:hypothetical protein
MLKFEYDTFRPVAYTSRLLNATEKKYTVGQRSSGYSVWGKEISPVPVRKELDLGLTHIPSGSR